MASIIGFMRRITFRLLFILFIVIVGLVLQGLFISDANEALNRLDALADKRLETDELIIARLVDSITSFRSIILDQTNIVQQQLLFNPDKLGGQTDVSLQLAQLKAENTKLINLLKQREFIAYDLKLQEVNYVDQFILGIDNETEARLGSIIETSDQKDKILGSCSNNCGNRGEFEASTEFNLQNLEFLASTADNLLALRDQIISDNTAITAELFSNDDSIMKQLSDIQFQFNSKLLVANQTTNSTYAFNVLTAVTNVFAGISQISTSILEGENSLSVQDSRRDLPDQLDFLEIVSDELEQNIERQTPLIQANLTLLNSIVGLEEIDIAARLTSLVNVFYISTSISYAENFREFSQSQTDLGIIIQGNGGGSVGDPLSLGLILLEKDFQTVFNFIFDQFDQEKAEFKLILAEIRETIQGRVDILNNRISLISILVIGILVVISIWRIIRSLDKLKRNLEKVSDGDLTMTEYKKYGKDELGAIERGFDNMIFDLRNILITVQSTTERIAGIAEELAAGAEEASASVSEVSETVREFSAGASEQNLMLNRVNLKLQDHIQAVEDASTRISQTSDFVLKVAKRTNILGLNASIEAAKAGRFGLGFNVVAEEVRNLSDDTKSSALQIADFIQSIEYNIKNTVEEIHREVEITKDVAENTAAGSEEANAATSEQVIMLSEISQTSNELSNLANELQEIVHRFVLDTGDNKSDNSK